MTDTRPNNATQITAQTEVAPIFSIPYAITALRKRKAVDVRVDANPETRTALAAELDLIDLPSLRVEASVTPVGRDQWRVAGTIRAKVVQACVVSLNPVSTTVEETFERRFTEDENAVGSDLDFDPVGDDPPEMIKDGLDVGIVATEALALALPTYPRAQGATFEGAAVAPPGVEPIRPDDLKPFAGLAALKKTLESKD